MKMGSFPWTCLFHTVLMAEVNCSQFKENQIQNDRRSAYCFDVVESYSGYSHGIRNSMLSESRSFLNCLLASSPFLWSTHYSLILAPISSKTVATIPSIVALQHTSVFHSTYRSSAVYGAQFSSTHRESLCCLRLL
ncbi:hypothetical protein BCR33DRAFT_571011 [Rhizoclosmatium globosum]|uniref:Secreted protein n=1 Tax=Rhizoclosmatium globosum TaxID=329046 RepID=A0A1Y2B5P2_9FUNG|nr:hypothetical protein BCR33DRAFT_571011 [Rhizoclosmatium globosum]|eukprot:ORY30159.1 hypothetical protein BCR33DRAFT_571011 [Rhizoclosmatium globosum]